MKKGQASLVGVMITLLVLVIVGIGMVIPVVSSIATNSNLLQSQALEPINFTTTNTNYTLSYKPLDETIHTATLYYFANTTFPLEAGKFTFFDTDGKVKIATNGTVTCYPNVTAKCIYYASYDWQPSNYGETSAIVGFIILLIVVVIIVGIIGMTGLGGK